MVGAPLTEPNFEIVDYEGRPIRVETSAEIIAKKMWHRGDQAGSRDLFDLCAVATFAPEAIDVALPLMERHAAAFLRRLDSRAEAAEVEFGLIEARSFQKPFWECLAIAHAILGSLVPSEEVAVPALGVQDRCNVDAKRFGHYDAWWLAWLAISPGLQTLAQFHSTMTRLNMLREGEGPIVVLSHALGCDLHMWDDVAAILSRAHTVLRYDHRNHGASELAAGPVTMHMLADDAAELIEREAEGEPVHFVGLSMGGMTAQALAAKYPNCCAAS